jgi:ArsR family transcriptional regulator, arsenate/arsenite/antimonite-responsive transcriptional repressor
MPIHILLDSSALAHICQAIYDWFMVLRKDNALPVELLFRALADPTRLRLLNLMAGREICVCYLVEILGISQPKISRHLGYLRRAGIVLARRQGRWMHYRLATPADRLSATILAETLKHLGERQDLLRDLAKLNSACCQPRKFKLPETAPQPSLSPLSLG